MKTEIERLKRYIPQMGVVISVSWEEKCRDANAQQLLGNSFLPHFRVELLIKPSQASHIRVVILLPEQKNWNGKFLGTGNGGFAGQINEGSLLNGISRGFATANTDMGMPEHPDQCIGQEEIYKDFGHRSTHLMTTEGKRITEYFYGKAPQYSYFIGGSTGGQQALSEAQRYPKDYDGIIALSPAHDRIRLHAWFVWNWQQIHKQKDGIFTKEQAQEWNEEIVKFYRENCGSNPQDPFLAYPGSVKQNPVDDPALQKAACKLSQGQRNALRGLYDGLRDPVTGKHIIAPFLPGTECEALSLVEISKKESFADAFFYPFRWVLGKDFDFMQFDFQKDLDRAICALSPILDATDPDLTAFREEGGKLLVIGGSVDAIIPYTGFLDYYKKAIEVQGGIEETKQFFRFFLMPGFSHTFGGPGVQDVGAVGLPALPRDAEHDVICAMDRWVSEGTAPNRLLGNRMSFTSAGIGYDHSRPAYAYPQIAVFHGNDPKDPEHYHPKENAFIYD